MTLSRRDLLRSGTLLGTAVAIGLPSLSSAAALNAVAASSSTPKEPR